MSSIYQKRQSELELLFIEAQEYDLLKGKTSQALPDNWEEKED